MLCGILEQARKASVFGIPVLLAALRDQPVGFLRRDHRLRLVGRGAEHPHRVIMRQHHIFDRLVGDGADPLDHLVGHRRRRLRVEHDAAVVADDHRGIGIAFGGESIEIGADFGEGDLFLRRIGGGRETFGHQFNSLCDVLFEFVLLLLLRLLTGIHHAPLGQRNRLAQHIKLADVIGQYQNQHGIEICALLVAQPAMRLDNRAKRVVGLWEIRAGGQRHDRKPQLMPVARANAASSAVRVGFRKRAAT
jgi:hypothetical protein